jgi:hypothetical protein
MDSHRDGLSSEEARLGAESKQFFDNQHARSLEALRLISASEAETSDKKGLQEMDIVMLTPFPKSSLRIHKPGFAKNGVASFQRNYYPTDDGRYRYFEADDADVTAPNIPIPNLLVGLNRYTRFTAYQEEYIMRIPIFGTNRLSKLVQDDIAKVVELTMSNKTFEAVTEGLQSVIWRDDKKPGVYRDFRIYGPPEDHIAGVWGERRVWKNMNTLFQEINSDAKAVTIESFLKGVRQD